MRRFKTPNFLQRRAHMRVPQERVADALHPVAHHRNPFTGLSCNCHYGRPKKAPRTASQNVRQIRNQNQKAFRDENGQQYLTLLEELAAKYDGLEPMVPWMAQQFKKGNFTVGQTYDYNEGELRPAITWQSNGIGLWLDYWIQWMAARQHPLRRGKNIMDMSPDEVQAVAQELQIDLEEKSNKRNWHSAYPNGTGKLVHTFDPEGETGPLAELLDKHKGWRVHQLIDYEDCEGESEALGHCIGHDDQNYKRGISDEHIKAYSLRDPHGYPKVSWHFNPDGTLAHVQGRSGYPKQDWRDLISFFHEKRGMEDDEGGRGSEDHDALQELVGPDEEYDATVYLPDPTDHEDYLVQNHPDGDYMDLAHEYAERGINEDTEIHHGNPQWGHIFDSLYGVDKEDQEHFFHTVLYNSYTPWDDPKDIHGHYLGLNNEIRWQLDRYGDDEDTQEIANGWKAAVEQSRTSEGNFRPPTWDWDFHRGGYWGTTQNRMRPPLFENPNLDLRYRERPNWGQYTELAQEPHFYVTPDEEEEEDPLAVHPNQEQIPFGWQNQVPTNWGRQGNTLEPIAHHRNPFTGLPCNCHYGRPNKSRFARTASQNVRQIRNQNQKAFRDEQGQAVLDYLEQLVTNYPDIEPMIPWFAQQYKKGIFALEPNHYGITTLRWDGQDIDRNKYWRWIQWMAARQHPLRRGKNIMQMDPGEVDRLSIQLDEDIATKREKESWFQEFGNGTGKLVHTFHPDHAGDEDEEELLRNHQGWRVHQLMDAEDCEGESRALGHCIGDDGQQYKQGVDDGHIQAYSLRDPDGFPKVSWHFNPDDTLAHIQGKSGYPKSEWRDLISLFHNAKGLDDDAGGSGVEDHDALQQAVDPYETEVTLPAAEDLDRYHTHWHPEGDYYDEAQEFVGYDGRGIGENTEINREDPNWEQIFESLHDADPKEREEFFHTVLYNSWETPAIEGQRQLRGHADDFKDELANQLRWNPYEESTKEIQRDWENTLHRNYWNGNFYTPQPVWNFNNGRGWETVTDRLAQPLFRNPQYPPQDDPGKPNYVTPQGDVWNIGDGWETGGPPLRQQPDWGQFTDLFRQSNILDPIHDSLPPSVWDRAEQPEPILKETHRQWIIKEIHKHAMEFAPDPEKWLGLVLTGSLTTYQYSPQSDCDVSLFVDPFKLPEWDRAKLIGIMIENIDGVRLPGTTYEMQAFVVPKNISREDLYQPGLRSGYDLIEDEWIQPPDKSRVHDVEREYNTNYVYALESADKMERLLRYEPDKAIQFWHQIHRRRKRDHSAGKGDFSQSNIVYKFLANRGLFPLLSEVSGEYIASLRFVAHDLWWKPGEVGKGLLLPNGELKTWPENEGTHMQMALLHGVPWAQARERSFLIRPDGTSTPYSRTPQEIIEQATAIEPRLKVRTFATPTDVTDPFQMNDEQAALLRGFARTAYQSVDPADYPFDLTRRNKSRGLTQKDWMQSPEMESAWMMLNSFYPNSDKIAPWMMQQYRKGSFSLSPGITQMHRMGIPWWNNEQPWEVTQSRYFFPWDAADKAMRGEEVEPVQPGMVERLPQMLHWYKMQGKGLDLNNMSWEQMLPHYEQWEAQQAPDPNAGTVVHDFGDGHTMRELAHHELPYEGLKMKNCAATFANKINGGTHKVISLRDAQGFPHATVILNHKGEVEDVRGGANQHPKPEYHAMLSQYLQSLPEHVIVGTNHPQYDIPHKESYGIPVWEPWSGQDHPHGPDRWYAPEQWHKENPRS